MADPYYKKTPYGWCLDHGLEDSKYDADTWQEHVEMLEKWLNDRALNYSVVHYKWMVRVHVPFSALKKMGFKNAVELHELASSKTNYIVLLGRPGPTHWDHVMSVRKYFLLNDLPIDQEE